MYKQIAAFVAVLALACPAFATVTSPTSTVSYTCSGNSIFTIPFAYLAASHVVATQTTTAGVTTTVIGTVKPSIAPSSGTITLQSACQSGYTLTLTRVVPLTQPQGFRTGSYSGAAHEQAFDRLEMQVQQNATTHATDKTAQAAKNLAQDTSIAAVTNGVSALNGSSQAVTSTSSALAFGSTTARTLTVWLADITNVKAFNAKGDGVTNDAAAIQAAWDYAVSHATRLYFPAGTYLINTGIAISASTAGMSMEGDGINSTTIKANAAMTSMLAFSGTTQNFAFSKLTLDGNALAQYGLNGASFAYGKLEKLRVKGTTVAGVSIQNGWDNAFRDCEFRDNTGDGVLFPGGQSNDVHFYNPLIANNTGWGLKTTGGGPLTIRGGAFESNAKGSIYSTAISRPLVVDGVYFEANAATGFTFTSPSKTVKTDILLNGSGTETTMAHAFDNANVTIRNCNSVPTNTEAFVYVISATTLTARDNVNVGAAIPLLKTWGDNTFAAPANVMAQNNAGFSVDFAVESFANSRSLPFSTWASANAPQRNYADRQGAPLYPKVTGVAGTTLVRGATKYNGRETVDVSGTLGDVFGVNIDTTVTTELANALVYVSAWAKASATTAGPRLFCGGLANTTSNAADTLWHRVEYACQMPAAGTSVVGIGRAGATSADVITYADVTIAVIGAPYLGFQRNLITPTFTGAAAPTTGTWAQGDVVWNSAPAAGGVPGWMCTTAGSPGTWKAMANLAP